MLKRLSVLVTGGSGLLGANLLDVLPDDWQTVVVRHHFNLSVPSVELNLNSDSDLRRLFEEFKPTAVVHAAALANVDKCERDRQLAYRVNVSATDRLAKVALKSGTQFIYISTDHIFDGNLGQYQADSKPDPLNYYAQTKWQGEQIIRSSGVEAAIIRTNFFGFNVQEKNDLAGWILEALKNDRPINLFFDVIFSPILVNLLAKYIVQIIRNRDTGIFHIGSHDYCSKYDFGMMIATAFGLETKNLRAISIDQFNLGAKRPKNMSLDVSETESRLKTRFPTVSESMSAYRQLFDSNYREYLKKKLI